MRLSIHKISLKNKDIAIKLLKSKKYKILYEKKINSFTHTFIISNPKNVRPIWLDDCSFFIDNADIPEKEKELLRTYKSSNISGALFVNNLTYSYCLTFGSSFLILKSLFDSEFSLFLAERLIDPNLIKHKGSRYITSKKNQVLTSYKHNTDIEYDIGESFNIIKGDLLDAAKYGKTASFGSSFQINPNIQIEKISEIIKGIESDLGQNTALQIPRISKETNKDKKEELEKELAEEIKVGKSIHGIFFDEFTAIEENNFASMDRYVKYIYVKKYRKSKQIINELSLQNIRQYFISQSIDVKTINILSDVTIHYEPQNETEDSISIKLSKLIFYISKKNQHIYQNGDWWTFNHEYIKRIDLYLNKINIVKGEIDTIPKGKDEGELNTELAKNHGYILLDKKNIHSDSLTIEIADLYKDNTLFFVKKGGTQSIDYLVDQAISSFRLLITNTYEKIDITVQKFKYEDLRKMCLWIFLNRKTTLKKLSEIDSLIAKMKLLDWIKEVKNAGYDFEIRIGYIK